MTADINQRACERHRHTATIEFSYFNRKHRYEGQTLNHCDEGICFKSEISFQPGAIVCIRAIDFHPNDACTASCRGLRLLTLAEAKWCKEISNETEPVYKIGARYFQPAC